MNDVTETTATGEAAAPRMTEMMRTAMETVTVTTTTATDDAATTTRASMTTATASVSVSVTDPRRPNLKMEGDCSE